MKIWSYIYGSSQFTKFTNFSPAKIFPHTVIENTLKSWMHFICGISSRVIVAMVAMYCVMSVSHYEIECAVQGLGFHELSVVLVMSFR